MEDKKINKQDALGIVSQVCSTFKGTLQEHQLIQRALAYLNTLEEKTDIEDIESNTKVNTDN